MIKNKKNLKHSVVVLQEVPDAIEGAYIVILAQNVLLISKPLTDIGNGGQLKLFHIIIILIALVNFFNISANWLSVRKVTYTQSHLFWDILTIAIFFVFAQLLTDISHSFENNTLPYVLLMTGIFYTLTNIVYIIWNKAEIINFQKRITTNDEYTIESLKKSNILNYFTIVINIQLGISLFYQGHLWVIITNFSIWMVAWVILMVFYISKQRFLS